MFSKKSLASSSGVAAPSGFTFWVPATYSFVVPTNVTSVAAIAIGAGGGGGGTSSAATVSAAGGGGGALSYSNSISVTPGETLTVVVGSGGTNGSSAGTAGSSGGDSYIRRSSTDLLLAKGGSGGLGNTGSTGNGTGGGAGGDSASGVGDTKNSGGAGGNRATNDRGGGGGGAAGYSSTGGTGGSGTTAPTAGSGGGGGGGFYGYDGSAVTGEIGGWGGGVQFYGSGTNGIAGVVGATQIVRTGGLGSSLGATTRGGTLSRFPGGGGGGASSDGVGLAGSPGEDGAVRIVWGGTKSFPSTNVTNSVSIFKSSNSSSSTITIPSGVVPGDLLVLYDLAFNISTNPTLVTPSGFTSMGTAVGNSGRIAASYKQVVNNSDSDSTITGMNGNSSNNKILLVIRGTNGYLFLDNTTVTDSVNLSGLGSTSLGTAGTVDSYAEGISVSLAAFYGSGGITPGTDIAFTGATFIEGASNVFYVGYKIYSQSDTAVQTTGITLADKGTNAWSLLQIKGY